MGLNRAVIETIIVVDVEIKNLIEFDPVHFLIRIPYGLKIHQRLKTIRMKGKIEEH